MTGARDTGSPGVAGGPALHIPVLARRIVEHLALRDGGLYLDGTFGAGGHTRLILDAANCRVIALDRDQSAIALGAPLVQAADGRLILVQERFSELESVLQSVGVTAVDGILLDVGVSSMQLDQAERGFSFRNDGPLDMRMADDGPTAADVIAAASERDLSVIIATLGEERFARPLARAIVAARNDTPIRTTGALVDIVSRVVWAKPGEIHPATRTFQALRIFVNEELHELADGLAAAERALKTGGRLAVISFHSLEDRIVKRFLSARSRVAAVSRHQPEVQSAPPSFRLVAPKPVVADDDEITENPRARSAKLRVAERTAAPAISARADALPRLPSLTDVLKGR